MNFELASVICFFLLIGILLWREKRNVEFKYGIVVRRWRGGMPRMERFVERNKKFLEVVGKVGIIVGFACSFLSISFLAYSLIIGKSSIRVVLPTVGKFKYPGPVISPKFWFWVGSVCTILLAHETMHAIFGILSGVKVEEYGIIFLLLLPFSAFVKLEEDKIKKLSLKRKLMVYFAGSLGNLLVSAASLCLLLAFSNLFATLTKPIGIKYQVLNSSPAYVANLSGMIVEIEGKQASIEQLRKILLTKNFLFPYDTCYQQV